MNSGNSAELPNENKIFKQSVKTVQLFKDGFELSIPVIQLNSQEQIKLSFDDLDSEVRRYRYTIIHCEADWTTTPDLMVSEYIDGYREENIESFAYSYNTTVKYIHYTLAFPTATMRPKISGNFILLVYDDEPSNVVMACRFMVIENSPVTIDGKVSQSARMEDRYTKQQLDFVVHLNGFRVMDVGREIKIVIQQNGRWDNLIRVTKPRFIRGDELDYRYDENIVFNGGNQFRRFDTKSLLYQSERVGRISYDTSFQVFLLDDKPRSYSKYVFEKDLNGRFYIKNDEHAENSDIEADYAWVHFFLPYPAMITSGQFYLLGALTSWNLDESNRMSFNFSRKGYELSLLLKQGYYNYLYVLKDKVKPAGDESLIEGSFWETENEYTIFFYFHETGSSYDRLIGMNFLNIIPQ